MSKKESLVTAERIESLILLMRGQKVLLDSDLAELYGTATKQRNEQPGRRQIGFVTAKKPDVR